MENNLRQIFKKIGITQQELADYLGITRQYLNSYLDETYGLPLMPQKYFDNILFLFECKTRDELFAEDFTRNARIIRKRMSIVRSTKDSIDNLFNVDQDKKIELFKIIEYSQILAGLDQQLLEAFTILVENLSKEKKYHALLSYFGKKYLIIDFDDDRYNQESTKAKEALFYQAFESPELSFEKYTEIYDQFIQSTKKPNDIDLEALKQSLSEMGYSNISQKEVLDLLNKYYEIKNNESEKE